MFGKARSREISKNVGAHAWAVVAALALCTTSARGGLLYRSSVVLDDDVICVGCVTKVTVTVEWEPICQDQTGAIVICDPPGAYPLATCTPAISSFVADLTLNGGACFVSGQAACGAAECVESGTCVHGAVTCPPPEYGCSYCGGGNTCGQTCQGFNISPGGSKTFWIKGLDAGNYTLKVDGYRDCKYPVDGGNELYHEFEDQAEFTVLSVDLDTDSDNDGHLNDGYDDLNGIVDDNVEEDFPGRHLWPNADNDNDNHDASGNDILDMNEPGPLAGENDLAEIQLSVLPEDFEGTATLTWPTSVLVWDDQVKTASSSDSFVVENLPSSLWVEGLDEAGTAELTLTVDNCCSDTSKITVFKVTELVWETYQDNWPLMDPCDNNGGKGIFPDEKVYQDLDWILRDLVNVKAKVTPVAENVRVYFKAWDVDDPFDQNNPTLEFVTGVDNDAVGPDNAGAHDFPFPTPNQQIQTDASGIAETQFRVSPRPGDNYRMSASCQSDALYDPIAQVMTQALADAAAPANQQSEPTPGVRLSEMLTVWRHLWLELDSMVAGEDNPINDRIIIDVWPDIPHIGESGAEIDSWIADDEARYEGGTLTVTDGGTYEIIDHWVYYLYDVLYVAGDVTGEAFREACFADDDGESELPRKPDISLMEDKFKPAYVHPLEETSVSQLDRAFIANVGITPAEQGSVADSKKDLITSPTYWTVQIMSCYQWHQIGDGDPDKVYHYHGPTDYKNGDGWAMGSTQEPGGSLNDNFSLIYLEAIRDVAAYLPWALQEGFYQGTPFTKSQIEQSIVVHEVSHVFIGPGHSDGGIMDKDSMDPADVFTGKTLKTIRTDPKIEFP